MSALKRNKLFFWVFCALFVASVAYSVFNLAKAIGFDGGQFKFAVDYFSLTWSCIFAIIAYQASVQVRRAHNRLQYVAKHILIDDLEALGYKWDNHDVYWFNQETEIGIHIGIQYIYWKVSELKPQKLEGVKMYKKDNMAVVVSDNQMLLFVNETLP